MDAFRSESLALPAGGSLKVRKFGRAGESAEVCSGIEFAHATGSSPPARRSDRAAASARRDRLSPRHARLKAPDRAGPRLRDWRGFLRRGEVRMTPPPYVASASSATAARARPARKEDVNRCGTRVVGPGTAPEPTL